MPYMERVVSDAALNPDKKTIETAIIHVMPIDLLSRA
jgi:hypothetical protein